MPLFACNFDHRDPHTFPTRRSSDLPYIAHVTVVELPPGSNVNSAMLCASKGFRKSRSIRILVGGAIFAISMRPFPTFSDRKSTRLNSSHMSISYAVFCLKKKTSESFYMTCRFLPVTSTTAIPTLSLHDALPIYHTSTM